MNKDAIEGARARIKSLYDPKAFAAAEGSVAKGLYKYFNDAGSVTKTRKWVEPEELLKKAKAMLQEPLLSSGPEGFETTSEATDLIANTFLSNAHILHSPRYMGHQVPPPLVVAGPFDMLGAATNQGAGLFEMGPMSSMAERAVAHEMIKLVGWSPEQSTFVGTSGGSLANLTAILAARNHRYPQYWKTGGKGLAKVPVILASVESHYSISRAAGILGLGTDQVVPVAIDARRRMDGVALKQALSQIKERGQEAFCIVGTAGTTPTGSFDPLDEIGKIAHDNGIWFHVDGAHGGSVLFSKKHRHLASGIELADSIIWDAHKLLFVPSLSTFLLFKNKEASLSTFQQDAPYLDTKRTESYDTITKTVECTKRSLALSLWSIWALYGPGVFEDLVNMTFHQTRQFYEMLSKSEDFQPLHEPQCNILCFKFTPEFLKGADDKTVSEFQKQVREDLVRSGDFYTTATRIDGSHCLRVTIINPLTDETHFSGLMDSFRKISSQN